MGCCGGRSSGRGRSRKFINGAKNKSNKRASLKKEPRLNVDKDFKCPYMDSEMDCKDCDKKGFCPKYGS